METPENTTKPSIFQSTTAKMILVGLLTLALLIPLELVKNLINERALRQNEVTSEINDKWGENVCVYGPILKVPYTSYDETVSINQATKETITQKTAHTHYAYFFPDELNAKARVTTNVLSRNNYDAAVFNSEMTFSGNYLRPDLSTKTVTEADIDWKKATILIRTTNLKGIKNNLKISFGATSLSFQPVYGNAITPVEAEQASVMDGLETANFDLSQWAAATKKSFSFKISYSGSREIKMIPIGKTTKLAMQSNWVSPGFTGNFLPEKKISANGFEANWKILHLNRAFSQEFFENLPDLTRYGFGVDFVVPVDQYQQNERASKYGFLVIGLTFLIFFLIQSISRINIHIFQYTMIGLALILFYTLLISITEHSSFSKAYVISAVAIAAMIGLYSISILRNRKFPLFISASLTAMYSFIYVIIQLENYALLVGSIGLFVILAAVMYFSRKIDWKQ